MRSLIVSLISLTYLLEHVAMTPHHIWRQLRFKWQKVLHLNRTLAFNWRPEAPLITAGVIGLLFETVARVMEPWPLKFIIDDVIQSAQIVSRPVDVSFGSHPLIVWGSAAVVLIAGLRAGSQYVSTISLAVVGNRFLTALRTRTFNHIQSLPIPFHDQVRTGDLVTRLVGDMGRLQEVGVTALLPMVVHSLTLLFMVIMMLLINLQLGLLSLCVFPLFWINVSRTGSRIRVVSRDQRKREGTLGAASAEAIAAIRTVQAMGLEKAMAERFGVENRRSADQSVRGKRLAARLERSVDLLIALATAIVLWRGSLLVVNRVLTPGDLLVFLAYLKNAFKPMRDMAKYSGRLASAFASAERIVELLEVPVQSADDQAAPVAPVQVSRIHFRSVSFAYPNRSIAIHDLHLQARVGEVLALVGPSGAGKSTLMNLLLRLYEPTAGQILFDDVNICHYGLSSLRRCIAIVPQESMLFNMSIRDNISIGAGPVSDARIQAAATLAGAHDFITRLPDGYDTVISERGGTLSGGQQRRLAIARAAVREAPVLILDEPMAGLDLHNRALVTQALDKLKANRIVLMIVHDAPSALAADQVVMLRDGRVVEMGKPSDLSSLEGPFSRHMLDSTPVSAAAS